MGDWREGSLARGVVWDLGHTAIALLLAELLFMRLLGIAAAWAYVLAAVVWPVVVAEFIWDGVFRGKYVKVRLSPFRLTWLPTLPSRDSLHDPATYLGASVYYFLAHAGRPLMALVVLICWGAVVVAYNWRAAAS